MNAGIQQVQATPDHEVSDAGRVPDRQDTTDPVLVRRFLISAELLGWIALVVGMTVVVAVWWLGTDIMARVSLGNVTMKANTAFGIGAAGLGVVAYRRGWPSWLVVTMATLVTAIGWATLVEYPANIRWTGFDDLLVRGDLGAFAATGPGRMGANVAINFALLGPALYLLSVGRDVRFRQILATIVALVASMALLGYTLGAPDFGTPVLIAGMSIATSVLQLALGLSLLNADPTHGFMQLIVSNRAGGHVIRFYVPLLSGTALGIAALAHHVVDPLTLDPTIPLQLAVGAIVVAASSVVIIIGHDLDRVDHERRSLAQIEHELRESVRSKDILLEQREAADKALRDIESLNRSILKAIPDQIYRLSPEGLYLSFQIPDVPGFFPPPERFVGRHIDDVLPTELAAVLASASRRARATGRPQTLEYRYEIDGSIRDREARVISIDDTAETIVIVRDITDRVHAQLTLEASLRSRNELISSISHELRTPLTAMMGFAEILYDNTSGISDVEQTELMRLIAQQSGHLTNIVDDLLTTAAAEAETLAVLKVTIELFKQAARVLETWPEENIQRVKLLGLASQRAIGDPARIRQIVRNLISNALKYGGANVRVDVNGDAMLSRVGVCDDGVEISLEVQGHMFDNYRHGNTRPGLTEPMGLGLALSRHLARLMDGDLTYRYSDGENVFELTLPTAA